MHILHEPPPSYGCTQALVTEEPVDLIGHVRICGGDGRVIGRFYPEADLAALGRLICGVIDFKK
jgi:hypothetical protein